MLTTAHIMQQRGTGQPWFPKPENNQAETLAERETQERRMLELILSSKQQLCTSDLCSLMDVKIPEIQKIGARLKNKNLIMIETKYNEKHRRVVAHFKPTPKAKQHGYRQ